MTEDTTPPESDEPLEDETSERADPPEAIAPDQPDQGIGVGTGIIVGASVGVLGAVVAALWLGAQPPTATADGSSGGDITGLSGDVRPGDPTPQRPATGADILPAEKTGGGTLILQNIGDLDSVAVLADKTTYTRAVYVRSGERVTIPDVAAGTYEVLMMLGRGWNGGRFTQAPTYQRLDQAIEFAERDVGSSTEYTQLTVSIEPMTAGLLGVRATEPFQLTAP